MRRFFLPFRGLPVTEEGLPVTEEGLPVSEAGRCSRAARLPEGGRPVFCRCCVHPVDSDGTVVCEGLPGCFPRSSS